MRLVLEGLSCGTCAAKIERIVSKMPTVKEATVSIATESLTIEEGQGFSSKETYDEIVKLVAELEPHVVVRKKQRNNTKKPVACPLDDGGGEEKKSSKTKSEATRDSHRHGGTMQKGQKIELILALIFFGLAFGIRFFLAAEFLLASNGLFLAAYLLSGYHVMALALKNIGRGQIFDENFLMTIATIGALVIGEWAEAAAVMIFFGVGEYFQGKAVDSARSSIAQAVNFNVTTAHLIDSDQVLTVEATRIQKGDLILVKPGEKIPADGNVIEGLSYLDTSPLTGESYPRKVGLGDEVLSGMINGNDLLKIAVTKDYQDSTSAKIMHLIEEAADKKGKTDKFITQFSRYYTPIIVFAALFMAILPPLLMAGANWQEWFYRSLIFLVVSCPCALVLSIPISYFGGIGRASKEGILIKGGNYLDVLNQASSFVFDKTGTLTIGQFRVLDLAHSPDYQRDDFLKVVTAGELYSNHPIAKAIRAYSKVEILESELADYREIPGGGTQTSWQGKEILMGNQALLKERKIKTPSWDQEGTIVYVAVDSKYLGYIVLGDQLKENSRAMIQGLKALGIKKTAMLSGDNQKTADAIGQALGMDTIIGDCLPQDKVKEFEKIKRKNTTGMTIYVGDGVNDAPVLAMADAGMAMGGLGSDAAIEAADIVLMKDDPSDIVHAVAIAKYTRTIMIQNIVMALGIKITVLVLTFFGWSEMYMAIFADVGAAILTILNTSRILTYRLKR